MDSGKWSLIAYRTRRQPKTSVAYEDERARFVALPRGETEIAELSTRMAKPQNQRKPTFGKAGGRRQVVGERKRSWEPGGRV